jgi:hypothetical protein
MSKPDEDHAKSEKFKTLLNEFNAGPQAYVEKYPKHCQSLAFIEGLGSLAACTENEK